MINIEMQSTVIAPLKCSVQIDTLGESFMRTNKHAKHLYEVKYCIMIPQLSMIDDILTVTCCGSDFVVLNAAVRSKVDNKRLEFGSDRCFKIHVGENSLNCPNFKLIVKKCSQPPNRSTWGTFCPVIVK